MHSNDVCLSFPLFLPHHQIYLHDNEDSPLLDTIVHALSSLLYASSFDNPNILEKSCNEKKICRDNVHDHAADKELRKHTTAMFRSSKIAKVLLF